METLKGYAEAITWPAPSKLVVRSVPIAYRQFGLEYTMKALSYAPLWPWRSPADSTRRSSSTATLFNTDSESALQAACPEQNSIFRDLLRHGRLLFLGTHLHRRFVRTPSREKRKVAIYQSREMAALTSLLQFVPLGGAITLLALHWIKHWVGEDPSILKALQFVAKLHEILMQASLVNIFVYLVRYQALDGYIPLGALSGAAQASQLSYLWSLDFISAIGSPSFGMWRGAVFAAVATIMMFMITAVGPSAAVLMIPRPNMVNVNATTLRYLNMSEASLYPVYLDDRSKFNL